MVTAKTRDPDDPIGAATQRLSELTPAECLVLLDPKKAEARELIRVSLQHLITKQAIRFERREEKTLFLRKPKDVPYLISGHGMTDYRPAAHEDLLLGIVQKEYDISFQRFARTVAGELRRAQNFKKRYVMPGMIAAGLIEPRRKFVLFKSHHLTSSGLDLKRQLEAFRKLSPAEVLRWQRDERSKIQTLLTLVGTNIIIMPELMETMRQAFDQNVFLSVDFDFEFSFSSSDFSSFDTSFDALGSGAFDSGGAGGGGDGGGGGGGDGGGGGGG